jgi:hypothetical protein
MPISKRLRDRQIYISTTLFTRGVRALIVRAGPIFGAIFVWLQFQDFPIHAFMANESTPMLLWHIGLSLYYISWIEGTNFDVDGQELVYIAFPERGRVPFHGIGTIVALIGAGVLLAWTAGDIQRFAIALDIFIIVDHVAWRYLGWLLKDVVQQSETRYQEMRDYFSLEELRVVCYQIQGNWKWWRFTGTLPIIILLNAFAFSSTIQSYISAMIVAVIPPPPLSTADASAVVAGLLVLLFVLVAEIWSWSLRIRTVMYIRCIDDLYRAYLLGPIILSYTFDGKSGGHSFYHHVLWYWLRALRRRGGRRRLSGAIPNKNWTQFLDPGGSIVETKELTITATTGNPTGIASGTTTYDPEGVVSTIVVVINGINTNGNTIFGLIGPAIPPPGVPPAAELGAGIDASGNVFVVALSPGGPSGNPVPFPNPKFCSYSGGKTTLTLMINSDRVRVTSGQVYDSGELLLSELGNFSLSAFGKVAIPALVVASNQPDQKGGQARFESINVSTQ